MNLSALGTSCHADITVFTRAQIHELIKSSDSRSTFAYTQQYIQINGSLCDAVKEADYIIGDSVTENWYRVDRMHVSINIDSSKNHVASMSCAG